jgi:hypothetical protein
MQQSGNSHLAKILQIAVCMQHNWQETELNQNKHHEELVQLNISELHGFHSPGI